MSVMTTIGHVMMNGNHYFTAIGKKRENERQSIKEVFDIRTFTVIRHVSSTRTTILRKHSEKFSARLF